MGSIEGLPYLKSKPKFIFFTDFDGTITLQDSNDYMTDNIGYGQARRKQGNHNVLEGRETFRESFRGMMDSITRPYSECIQSLVDNIKLDPFFKDFLKFAMQNNIPVVILSSGMVPVIRALLRALVGEEMNQYMDVVANDVKARPGRKIDEEGGWEIEFHDDSGFGHDKSLTLRPYAHLPEGTRPTMFYAGDGVSDLSAARETDLLFAKKGHDLITYCVQECIPFTVFEDWSSITEKVKEIVAGTTSVKDAAREGHQLYKHGAAGVKVDVA